MIMLAVGQPFNRNLKSLGARMAVAFSNYSLEIENAMQLFYHTLSEKERRRYPPHGQLQKLVPAHLREHH
jgi:hypothetical protein